MIWYSLSVSVSAGATVIESPVCTPIGSTFSIEQMMMQLSAWSRTTSISYSFQPSTDSSTSTSVVGARHRAARDDDFETLRGYRRCRRRCRPGEGRADDRRQADLSRALSGILPLLGDHAARDSRPILVIASRNSSGPRPCRWRRLGADHLDAVFFERAHHVPSERGVQRGLAAHGRQQRIGRSFSMILATNLGRDRLDIGRVRQCRVGHDRGRVRIHQDDPVAFFLQRLAGLRAGIVELAGLADDDRPGADDQDGFNVCAFGHDSYSFRSNRRTVRTR
jgi:hypothetical protein